MKTDEEIEIENARKIIGLRNRIIHGYNKISDDLVWSIVINHLPKLKEEILYLMDPEAALIKYLKEAVKEVNLIKQGKATGQPIEDLLNEL